MKSDGQLVAASLVDEPHQPGNEWGGRPPFSYISEMSLLKGTQAEAPHNKSIKLVTFQEETPFLPERLPGNEPR